MPLSFSGLFLSMLIGRLKLFKCKGLSLYEIKLYGKSFYVYLVPRWTQQLSPTLWLLFLLLYLCEIVVLVIYLSEWEFHWKVSTWFV